MFAVLVICAGTFIFTHCASQSAAAELSGDKDSELDVEELDQQKEHGNSSESSDVVIEQPDSNGDWKDVAMVANMTFVICSSVHI
jgi:hypothetical protein